ncbi:excalibur calcium-binding domain-containing protein [Dermatobacter hominis]|uniref:excalibur calcium-binding domain-containing protein n=1 Tax=Dermatobacter hominis TaxID=2884263 RepID=UPI001D1245A3|nr:excalibur calcium-binding domain-containing protein [Dermatobacter hominis]UDY36280.1 excalibur calcium-binding domain-containing protein [Dermatobacter hominis]
MTEPTVVTTVPPVEPAPSVEAAAVGRSFSSCADAAAAGYFNMQRGQPGYSSGLDRDDDGVACETDDGVPRYGNPDGTVTTTTAPPAPSTTTTTPPTTTTTAAAAVLANTAQQGGCDPNYSGACVPIAAGDTINCDDVPTKDFRVVGSDPYRLDEGGIPGVACESESASSVSSGSTSSGASSAGQLAQTGGSSVPMAALASGLILAGLLAFLARGRLSQVRYIVVHSKTGAIHLVPKARRFE